MKGTSLPTGAALALATIAVAFGFRLAPSFSGGGAPCGGPYTISDFQTTGRPAGAVVRDEKHRLGVRRTLSTGSWSP